MRLFYFTNALILTLLPCTLQSWSASAPENLLNDAWARYIFDDESNVERRSDYKYVGFSVRCVKD